jgi:multiple sugar transport system ATP-binding protein
VRLAKGRSVLSIGDVSIPIEKVVPVPDGTAVTVGIRPEHLVVGPPSDSGMSAKVELIEPTGFGTIVHLKPFGEAIKAYTLDRAIAVRGEAVSVNFPARHLHLFDAEAGRRLN